MPWMVIVVLGGDHVQPARRPVLRLPRPEDPPVTELHQPRDPAPSEIRRHVPEAVATRAAGGSGADRKSISPRQMAFKRFMSHKPAVIATVVLLLMIIFVLLAPITARYGINEAVFTTGGEQGQPLPLAAVGGLVRHRRDRPRPLQPPDLRHPRVAGHRLCGGRHRRRHRHGRRRLSPASGAGSSTTC